MRRLGVLIKTKLLARVYVLFDAPRLADATKRDVSEQLVDGLSQEPNLDSRFDLVQEHVL